MLKLMTSKDVEVNKEVNSAEKNNMLSVGFNTLIKTDRETMFSNFHNYHVIPPPLIFKLIDRDIEKYHCGKASQAQIRNGMRLWIR